MSDNFKLETKTEDEFKVGERIFICDYRQSGGHKPIRHIRPMEVMIVSNDELPKNKTVYYSEYHFRPYSEKTGKLLARVIAPFDNTGYRSYTGVKLNMYRTMKEAQDKYNEQYDKMHVGERIAQEDADKVDVLQEKADKYDFICSDLAKCNVLNMSGKHSYSLRGLIRGNTFDSAIDELWQKEKIRRNS